jgi:hypothetical protein
VKAGISMRRKNGVAAEAAAVASRMFPCRGHVMSG